MKAVEIIENLKNKMMELSLTPYQLVEGDDVSEEDWESLKDFCGGFSCKELQRQNSYYICIIHFTVHDVYVRFIGSYDSWAGADWSDACPYEVKPVVKTITVWESV